jgi:glycosyltransferase involved in cell wall biosynthesis
MPYLKGKCTVLFVYTHLVSFVRKDLEILQKRFSVRKMNAVTFFVPRKGRDKLVFFKLIKRILQADIVYSWFADLNAFFIVLLCRILGKKSVIVVGGYDVIYVPEINYGQLNSWWGRIRAKFVLEHATRILPFSYYAKDRVLSITRKSNVRMMPLGCDTEKFKPTGEEKKDLVITVCNVDQENVRRKGLKTFVESAKFWLNVKFALIGRQLDESVDYLRQLAPSNVEFVGYVSDEELVRWYQRAKVYCQLSYEEGEGAGGALGEAMACECIPVVSEKALALRETVASYGFYVPFGDARATAKAIGLVLQAPPELGANVRKHIKEFSIEKREHALTNLIEALT